MQKTKRDREAEKKNRAIARKRDIQDLYLKLRANLKSRNEELLRGKQQLEAGFNMIKTRHDSIYKDALFLIQQCEQRILDYTYALDNQEPPFAGNGLPAAELIEKASAMLEVLSLSLFRPADPVAAAPVEATKSVEDPDSVSEEIEESEEPEDSEDPTLDTLDTI